MPNARSLLESSLRGPFPRDLWPPSSEGGPESRPPSHGGRRPVALPGVTARRIIGRRVAAALLPAALLCTLPAAATAQVTGASGQNVMAGARVFGTRGCNRCHAIRGLGGDIGPDLARSEQSRSFFEFAADMWNHLPQMVRRMGELGIERPRLTSWELGDLIAFLYWQDYFAPPGDTARGARLFVDKGCVACHQVRGVGGVVGPNLDFLNQYGSPVQIIADMWNHGPTMAEMMRERGVRRPRFAGSELTDLLAYLKSSSPGLPTGPAYVLPGDADQGRRLFEEMNCIQCHSVRGHGGTIGPDLAEIGRQSNLIQFAAAMWNKAPAMTAAMNRAGIKVPQLGAEEMADLLAYLYSVQYSGEAGIAARGRQLVRDKRCLDCHALSGRGGRTAPDLASARGPSSETGVVAAMWNHVVAAQDVQGRSITWPTLTAQEMADLSAFLVTLGGNQ